MEAKANLLPGGWASFEREQAVAIVAQLTLAVREPKLRRIADLAERAAHPRPAPEILHPANERMKLMGCGERERK